MGAPLLVGPGELHQVEPFSIALSASDAVCRLGYWVPGQGGYTPAPAPAPAPPPAPAPAPAPAHLWNVKGQSSFTNILRLLSLLFQACFSCSSLQDGCVGNEGGEGDEGDEVD